MVIPPMYNTKGGNLNHISMDSALAVGNKHNESRIDNTAGIKLLDKGGNPIAEIEDGEVVKNNSMVFSDQTKVDGKRTYADIAKILANKKKKAEKGLKGDALNKKTAELKIANIDREENMLFAKQEMEKLGNSTNFKNDIYAEGGKFDINTLTPFIDNIGNAILTANTPKLREPNLVRRPKLQTTYNINPQLAELKEYDEKTTKTIMDNTSNSNIARNQVAANRLRTTAERNKILANKENMENQLKNQQAIADQRTSTQNASILNRYSDMLTRREGDIQSRISQNLANVAGDIIDKRNFDAQDSYNRERLDIAKKTPSNQGIVRRADLANPFEINYLKNNPQALQEALKRYQGTPEEEEFRKLLGLRP